MSLGADFHRRARAGRSVPAKRLCPAHRDRHQGVDRGAVRVGGHAARIVGSLTPKWRGDGLLANLRGFAATLRRQSIAHAVRCIHRCGVQQEHRGESQCLEEGSHEGEVKVYRSNRRPQQIATGIGMAGGETEGARCRIVGEESVQIGVGFTPRCSWAERGAPGLYSRDDAGFSTEPGKPGIARARTASSRSKPLACSRARPT